MVVGEFIYFSWFPMHKPCNDYECRRRLGKSAMMVANFKGGNRGVVKHKHEVLPSNHTASSLDEISRTNCMDKCG